jgi:superfamily I DNA/RNA helicase
VHAFHDRRTELDGLVHQVREWLAAGIEAHAIGIATRTNSTAKEVREALDQAGITGTNKRKADVVRVETMHGMKGLEFRCAAVVGVDQDVVPLPAAVTPIHEDPAMHAQDTLRERCLLFVASTRARDALYVSHIGEPSAFLVG